MHQMHVHDVNGILAILQLSLPCKENLFALYIALHFEKQESSCSRRQRCSRHFDSEDPTMKPLGIVLIIAGLVALIYGGIQYTSHKREVDMGPVQITKTEHHTIPLPPLLGVASIAVGGVLIFAGGRAGR